LSYIPLDRDSTLDYGSLADLKVFAIPAVGSVPIRKLLRALQFSKALFHINLKGFDVVNYHYVTSDWVRLALRTIPRSILTFWGSDALLARRGGHEQVQFVKALRKATRITFDSSIVAERLAADAGHGISSKLDLIGWGVDATFFRPLTAKSISTMRKAFDVENGTTVLLSNRTVADNFCILDIVQWFRSAVKTATVLLLVHVPWNSDATYLARCEEEAQGDGRIRFNKRKLSIIEIRDMYLASTACLHFARSDATPVSMLEAIACGKSIICSAENPAYSLLSRRYEIHLAHLPSLLESEIVSYCESDPQRAIRNRSKLELEDSENATVQKLSYTINLAWGRGENV
jgi:glycosyltransferase involved in cell wall biosynthesis